MKKGTCPTRPVVTAIAVLVLLMSPGPAGPAPASASADARQTSPAAAHVEKAQAALASSEFVNAENELRLAIAADPKYALSYSWLGEVFAAQPGREKDGLQNVQKAAEMAPKDGRVLALLADVQLRQDIPGVLKTAEQAAQLNPGDALAQAVLALAYTEDSQWEKAHAAAVKAVTLDPKLAQGYYALGAVYAQLWDGARAQRAMEEAVRLEPKSARWLLSLGKVLENLGDADSAAAKYDAAAKIVPDYPPALIATANLMVDTNYAEIAQRKVDRAVKVAPNLWQTRLLQGRQAASEGKYEAAEAHFQRALVVSPENYRVLGARANAKLDAGECSEAKTILEKLVTARPRLAGLHSGLARAYLCLEDSKKALAEAEKAVDLNPYDPWIRTTLAWAQQGVRPADEVMATYAMAGAVAPDPVEFIREAGRRYMEMEQYAEAETELALAIKLGAEDVETEYRLCLARLAQEEYADAADACAQAHELDPELPAVNQMYGLALVASGRPKEAIPLLQDAIDGDKEDADSHKYLGLAYIKTRQYKQAQAEYEAYVKQTGEEDQAAQGMLDLLKAGWSVKDADAISQLNDLSQKLLDGRMKAKITGKTVKDRRLVLDVTSDAKDTPEQMTLRAAVAAGLAAVFGARLEPAIAGASINGLDAKGKPYLTFTAELDGLQDIVLQIVSESSAFGRFKVDAGAPGEQEVTKEDIDLVGKEASEVRGLKVQKPISVTMITQEQFAAQYKEEVATATNTDGVENEAMFRLLGVLGPNENLDSITGEVLNEQIIGYYDNETEDLRVLKGKMPSSLQRLTIAHEYVHALQDQHFAAMDGGPGNSDASLAVSALVEGDATLSQFQYLDKKLAMADTLQMVSDALGELDQEALESAPEFLNQLLSFPYEAGRDFVTAAFERGGWKAVNELYARLPLSTEQVLHPERYRANEKPLAVKLPQVTSKLGAGWSLAGEEVMGELAWRALLQPYTGPTFAAEAAAGWGGDRYALVKDKAGTYAVAIRADWDSLEDQQQFSALLRMALRNRKGYDEQTDDLLGANPVRLWQGPENWWAISADGKRVHIGIAKTSETAEKLVAAVAQ